MMHNKVGSVMTTDVVHADYGPRAVDVFVVEGVVTLTGHVERKSEKAIALLMTARIDGVVGVVDELTYRLDDARLRTGEPQARRGTADDRPRRP